MYNIWTIDSENESGNEAIWDSLIGLGVDGSDINILGPPPGLSDVDAFQLNLNTEQYENFKIEVSTGCRVPLNGITHYKYRAISIS